jgi:hypothetical protein
MILLLAISAVYIFCNKNEECKPNRVINENPMTNHVRFVETQNFNILEIKITDY